MEWRVFFIGPMAAEQVAADDAAAESAGSGRVDHFGQMVDAVAAVLMESGYQPPRSGQFELTGGKLIDSLTLTRSDGDVVSLLQPHELFAQQSISDNVFDAIDDADLVIADLSLLRPAVIYELAFAHALGIWTIPVSSPAEAEPMFYLRQYRHVVVDFSRPDIRNAAFDGEIQGWIAGRNKRFDARNPLTDFYDAPIPDISAAFGLATGYVENFLTPVLSPGAVIVDVQAGTTRPVAGVLTVRPPNLRSLTEVLDDTATALRTAFPDRFQVGDSARLYVQTPASGPRTCAFVVGGWLVDVPRTVLSLARSPRVNRADKRIRDGSRGWEGHVAGVLIERFLRVAGKLLEEQREVPRARQRFISGSLEEIVAFLRGQSTG